VLTVCFQRRTSTYVGDSSSKAF